LKQVFSDDPVIYKRLRKQVFLGTVIGLGICLGIGGAFIAVWYTVASNLWKDSENLWEGVFCVIASVLITAMGLAMLRTERMQEKWKAKLSKSFSKEKTTSNRFKMFSQKYAFFMLPFVTILREGLEAIVFLGGVCTRYSYVVLHMNLLLTTFCPIYRLLWEQMVKPFLSLLSWVLSVVAWSATCCTVVDPSCTSIGSLLPLLAFYTLCLLVYCHELLAILSKMLGTRLLEARVLKKVEKLLDIR
jgi:FTR1 family protein